MYCGMLKGMCLAEAMSNSEKIKLIDLATIELHLSEGISQSVSSKFHLIIINCNLLKAFWVDLKACLGL